MLPTYQLICVDIEAKIAAPDKREEQRPVSIFVDNLPAKLHWKGLWQIFGRYCDVLNAFIANKQSRRGSRFGFVKVSNKKDATRAMERLNGQNVYGSRISVMSAKFQKDKGEVRTSNMQSQKGPSNETIWERGESSKNEFKGRKRITGHVETEDLWKMRRCLVGRMATVCSIRSIELRLQSWGLGEIKVQRLGGKTFLISIDDEDLFLMLEDLQWSYLKEIFVKEKQRVNSDSESTSDPSEKMAPTVSPNGEGSERRSVDKDGSFIEPCFGNDYGEKLNTDNEAGSRLDEMDLMGDSFKEVSMHEGIDIFVEIQEKENESTKQTVDNWAEMGAFGPRC
ncbi:hypothetical protein GQ457_07G001600 [Hibiscus cannabinus]